jgi:poly-gamma-glutamate synthesis protein (capsule biosynthesis protein)
MTDKKNRQIYYVLIVLSLLFSSCTPQANAAPLSTQPVILSPTGAPINGPVGLHLGVAVPAALRQQAQGWNVPATSSITLDVSDSTTSSTATQIQWLYALVAPFPTVSDGVSADELKNAWLHADAPGAFHGFPLLMDESTQAAFTALWGAPATDAVKTIPTDQLLETAWSELPAWAIIPFEELEPKWKVLTIDSQSPIRKKFNLASYPLVVNFAVEFSPDLQPSTFNLQPSNYNASKLTTVIMTGVTALVRATAFTMERKGVLYPGEAIRDTLREADIAHISNEIPFVPGCSEPQPDQTGLVFCSDPKYINLILDVGADVIELTGNHFADYGPESMVETIDIYNQNDLPYFGGGLDRNDSLKPALFELNGNKIAFIGCNRPDTGAFPTATDERPGAAPCEFDTIHKTISNLKSHGFTVIATFQWVESYDPIAHEMQIDDFQGMVDAGADIVSGSQAHYAQNMEFYKNSFIHFGLGNLFFDQMDPNNIQREFLDRYVIYNGKFISTELITARLEDYSRPRLMTGAERAPFLEEYFQLSGWTLPTPTATP